MWPGFDVNNNFICERLRRIGPISLSRRNPDVLFYSVFGSRNFTFRGKKVLVLGEAHSSRFGDPDFEIGFNASSPVANLRFPIWAWNLDSKLLIPSKTRYPRPGDKFCNFIYSNPSPQFRNFFFLSLNERSPVESLGSVLTNVKRDDLVGRQSLNWQTGKQTVLSDYRFTLALENVSQPGYSTEKITDAFLAGTIPIYWGDPFIENDFQSDSFINLMKFVDPVSAVDYILDVDSDPSLVQGFRSVSPMTQERFAVFSELALERFLRTVLAAPGPSRSGSIKRATRLGPKSLIDRRNYAFLETVIKKLLAKLD
jgi:hypothetical protein